MIPRIMHLAPSFPRLAALRLAAIPLLGASPAVAQHSPSTTSTVDTLRFVAPWLGGGLGLGRVKAQGAGPAYLEAGPSVAATLHAGVDIATRIFLAAEFYGQAGFIIEDSRNSASFNTVTAGARVWRGLMLKGGLGTGTYTLDNSHPAHNAPSQELGFELVGKPRLAQGSVFLQCYSSRGARTASGYRLSGLVMGGSLRIYLLDALLDSPR